jgi:O-antigen/teichoic acid export membrane protein
VAAVGDSSVKWPTSYSVALSLAAQGLQVLQAIVIARHLGPDGRGELGLIQWAPPLIAVIAGFGLTQALSAVVPRDPARGPVLFWTAFRIALIFSLGTAVLLALVFNVLEWPSTSLAPIAIAYLVMIPLEIAHSFPREYSIAVQRFALYDLLKVSFALLGFVGVLVLVYANSVSPTAVAVALILSSLAQLVVSWAIAGRLVWPPTGGGPSRSLLRFGGLCMLSGFSGVAQVRVFQYAIASQVSVEALGVFIVVSTWGGLGSPIWQAIQVRRYPVIAQAYGAGEGTAAFDRTLLLGAVAFGGVSLAGAALSPLLFPWVMGSAFSEYGGTAVAFALAVPIQAFATLASFGIRAMGRPGMALAIDYFSAASAITAAVVLGHLKPSLESFAWGIGLGGMVAAMAAVHLSRRIARLAAGKGVESATEVTT